MVEDHLHSGNRERHQELRENRAKFSTYFFSHTTRTQWCETSESEEWPKLWNLELIAGCFGTCL